MKLGAFLVPEERVWDPDLLLSVEAQSDHVHFGVRWIETESLIAPGLTEVDADLIILNNVTQRIVNFPRLSGWLGSLV